MTIIRRSEMPTFGERLDDFLQYAADGLLFVVRRQQHGELQPRGHLHGRRGHELRLPTLHGWSPASGCESGQLAPRVAGLAERVGHVPSHGARWPLVPWTYSSMVAPPSTAVGP